MKIIDKQTDRTATFLLILDNKEDGIPTARLQKDPCLF